jgi:hypothetical protein
MPRPIWVAPKPAYAGILKQLNLPCSPNGGGARSSLISRNNEPLVRMPPSGARPDASLIRRLATPQPIKDWSLTSLKEKLIKIGAKVVSHGRYVAFQMAEVAIRRPSSPTSCG